MSLPEVGVCAILRQLPVRALGTEEVRMGCGRACCPLITCRERRALLLAPSDIVGLYQSASVADAPGPLSDHSRHVLPYALPSLRGERIRLADVRARP